MTGGPEQASGDFMRMVVRQLGSAVTEMAAVPPEVTQATVMLELLFNPQPLLNAPSPYTKLTELTPGTMEMDWAERMPRE